MPLTNFPNGVSSFGFPVLPGIPPTTGLVLFVCNATNANGSDGNNGLSPSQPLATLAKALTLVAASRGDTIIVMPGHAETTTAVALSVAGVNVIGLGYGRNRPAFTATTAASDLFAVSAANVSVQNVRLVGAASGVTALLDINAADFFGRNIVFEHGATPTTAVTIPASAHRWVLEDCNWRGTAAGPAIGISVEGKVDDWKLIRARADYGGSSGLDTAFFSSSFKMKGYEIIEPIVVAFDTTSIDINSSTAAVGDGILYGGGSAASTGVTIANALDLGGCANINHALTDTVAAKGLIVPTATST
jgi:hypothetical protein